MSHEFLTTEISVASGGFVQKLINLCMDLRIHLCLSQMHEFYSKNGDCESKVLALHGR